jgi:hypothetical protein
MRHKDLTRALVEEMEGSKTLSSSHLILQHTPEAFNRIEVMAAPSGQKRQPKARLPMGERRRERVRAVDATAIDDQHHLFPRGTKRGHHLLDIAAPVKFAVK